MHQMPQNAPFFRAKNAEKEAFFPVWKLLLPVM